MTKPEVVKFVARCSQLGQWATRRVIDYYHEAIVRTLKAGNTFDMGTVGKIVVVDGKPVLRPKKDLLREMKEAAP